MHNQRMLKAGDFGVRINDRPAHLADVFPRWGRADRLAVVLDEPFATVGMDLLLQGAMERYYDLRRATHAVAPTYPEVYIFHVGAKHGLHGAYDLIPGRKEVLVPADSVWRLIVAMVDRGITHVAIPDRDPVPFEWEKGVGGWYYATALLDHAADVYAYGAEGRVRDADIEITALDDVLLANRDGFLHPEIAAAILRGQSAEAVADMKLGFTSVDDMRDFADQVDARVDEVPVEVRQDIEARLGGLRTQQFRRSSSIGLLERLKAVTDRANGASTPDRPPYPYRAVAISE